MTNQDRWQCLEKIVFLNGGKLVGKTRLQKTVYLLQEMGMDLGYDFEYHYYGPYSEGVEDDAKWAEFLGCLRSKSKPGFHEIPYTEFELSEGSEAFVSEEGDDRIKHALSVLHNYPAVILELSATLQFLSRNGYENGAEEELRLRKPGKASDERIKKATKLLEELRI